VITLVVFAGFSAFYLKEPLGWNHGLGFAADCRRCVSDFSQMVVSQPRAEAMRRDTSGRHTRKSGY
jgi:hypothetical protein